MSEKPILYNLNMSPPVRSVKTIARLIDLELDIRDLDVMHGEHLEEPFIKINPEHTVPTLDDNGEVIWDSHAISTYLVDKFASDDLLYPKDLVLRARCNQRLFFNNGNLFQRFRNSTRCIFGGASELDQSSIDQTNEAYDILEKLLDTDPFLVGEQLTVADICASTTLECLDRMVPLNVEAHPNTIAWLNRVKETVPFYDEMNAEFVDEYDRIIKATMEKNQNN